MKKLVVVAALVLVLTVVLAPAVLAWGGVSGQVVDRNGNPWTLGGTVFCQYSGMLTPPVYGFLDTSGYFAFAGLDQDHTWTCTIAPTGGAGGTPAQKVCIVPAEESSRFYPCGTISTDTDPTAITLSSFGAAALPWGAAVIALGLVVGGGALRLRRR